jgi:FkbM family methyltransferase
MKQLIRNALQILGYEIQGIRYCPRHLLVPENLRVLEFDDVICRRMFEFGQAFTFIQVGAFDGVTKDPLRKYIDACCWSGILLEPQPRPAAQLRELYRENDRIVVLEAALDRQPGKRSLFTVDCDEFPKWAGGMASFDRTHIVRNSYLFPTFNADTMISEIAVDCVSFDSVLEHVGSNRIDLLQIDAEGADGFVLSLFPFDRMQPAIIHWESKNMTKSQQEATLEMLRGHGYSFARSGKEDMLAVIG